MHIKASLVLLVLVLLIVYPLEASSSLSHTWTYVFTPEVVEESFDEVWGGDSYYLSGSTIKRVKSGYILVEDFEGSISHWISISGTWELDNGWLVGTPTTPPNPAIIQYEYEFKYAVFEARLRAEDYGLITQGLTFDSGDTQDPFTSSKAAASVAVKTGTATAGYNPPQTVITLPGEVPVGEVFYLRIYYKESDGWAKYDAYVKLEGGEWWVVVKDQSVLLSPPYPVWYRLATTDTKMACDYVYVYESPIVRVSNLPPYAAVQLVSEGEVLASALADSSGIAQLNVSEYLMPLRNVKVRVIKPPCVFRSYIEGSLVVFCDGGQGMAVISEDGRVVLIYSYQFQETKAIRNVEWVVPSHAEVINLTLVSGGDRVAVYPRSEAASGDYKLVDFYVDMDVDSMELYMEAPNIIESMVVRSLDRGVDNPPEGNSGESFESLVRVSLDGAPLEGALVDFELIDRPTGTTIGSYSGYTNASGEVSFGITYPQYSTGFLSVARYPGSGTPLYFGRAYFETKLNVSLTLEAPEEVEEGEYFDLTARLYAAERGIPGQEVVFQQWTGTSWVDLDTGVTDSSGCATITVRALTAGVLRIRAVYERSEYYTSAESNYVDILVKAKPICALTGPGVVYVNKGFTLTATLTRGREPIPGKTIIFERSEGGVTWEEVGRAETNNEGKASLQVSEEEQGIVYYRARFPGDEEYAEAVSPIITVEVKLIPTTISLSLRGQVNATIPFTIEAVLIEEGGFPLQGRALTLYRNGEEVETKATDSNGRAVFTVVEHTPGTCTYEVAFEGDEEHESARGRIDVEIHKLSVRLTISSPRVFFVDEEYSVTVVARYVNGSPISGITLFLKAGSTELGNKTTDERGACIFTVSFKAPGRYDIVARYPGDELRYPGKARIRVTVSKLSVALRVKELPSKVEEKTEFEVKIMAIDRLGRPVKGLKITVYREGRVEGSGVTRADGVAVIKLVAPDPGTYTYVAVSEETIKYYPSETKFKINVSIATWKIVLTGVGVASIAAGIAFFLRRRKPRPPAKPVTRPPPRPPPPEVPAEEEEVLPPEEEETRVYE